MELSNTDNTSIEKIKAWYDLLPVSKTQSPGYSGALPKGVPDWDRVYFDLSNKIYLVSFKIPSNKENGNSLVKKYLIVGFDSNGGISGKGYAWVLTDKSSSDEALLNTLVPEFIIYKQVPAKFSGTIITYSMDNNILSSGSYENGKLITGKKSAIVGKTPETINPNAPIEGGCENGQTCTDWYWQHYVNGELIYEIFLFTTCECNEVGGGGGGGNGGSTCQQQLQEFANEGNAISGPVYTATESNNGSIWVKSYNWLIFQAGTWGLMSYEKGTLEKKYYPNNQNRWEFQSFDHMDVLPVGTSIGGNRTFQVAGAPIINMTPTRMSVWMRIDFSVTSSIACLPFSPLTNVYNANKTFYAPNTVVYE